MIELSVIVIPAYENNALVLFIQFWSKHKAWQDNLLSLTNHNYQALT